MCILLRAYMLAPLNVEISSDGDWEREWLAARRIYKVLWPDEVVWCPWTGPEFSEGYAYTSEKNTMPLGPWTLFMNPEGGYQGPKELLYSEQGEYRSADEWVRITARTRDEAAEAREKEKLRGAPDLIAKSLRTIQLEFPAPSDLDAAASCAPPGVDFAPMRAWLSQCERDEEHDTCKAAQMEWGSLSGVQFKLIDTRNRCVVDADKDGDVRFIALSYVWGGNQPQLTLSTAPLLMKEGGLNDIWFNLPATIRDAILVCEGLGERYLWVDALCITQDSMKEKRLQLLRMREIYSAAVCTIAAVSAKAAKEGFLSSTGGSSRCKSETEFDDLLKKAPWSTRAWCYQEKVLSHRMIFFTLSGVYLQCQKRTFNVTDDIKLANDGNNNKARFDRVGAMLSKPPGEDLESFLSAVEYYSQRELTDKDDKINAFQGVFQRYNGIMDGMRTSFHFGLPICAYDQTFCWRGKAGHHHSESRNYCFPSWSWLGWDSPVTWGRELVRHARSHQMMYDIRGHADGDARSIKLRKPIRYTGLILGRPFGFPSADMMPTREAYVSISASVTDLRIASNPIQVDSGSNNGLYAIYPVRCSQQGPLTPPRVLTHQEWSEHFTALRQMGEATAETLSLPAEDQTTKTYYATEHQGHAECEAQCKILGHIWLDRVWRDAQPKHCVMEFMALHGEKDKSSQVRAEEGFRDDLSQGEARRALGDMRDGGYWTEKYTITMLMLMRRMAKTRCGERARERVQVMDCKFSEDEWAWTGAQVIDLMLY